MKGRNTINTKQKNSNKSVKSRQRTKSNRQRKTNIKKYKSINNKNKNTFKNKNRLSHYQIAMRQKIVSKEDTSPFRSLHSRIYEYDHPLSTY